ncbi:MAG: N-6 DNA methylase [Spirochaetes bacterium]|nr:N-6 DNA methylase [Spirochaetota bacterium]
MKNKFDSYITHNIHYIDYCIGQLKKDIIANQESSNFIQTILEYLLFNREIPLPLSEQGKLACNDLLKVIQKWDIIQYGDIAGYIYQQLKDTDDKKKRGQYFTPPAIVQYMVHNALQHYDNPYTMRILDPACGSGQFLIYIFQYLLTLYKHLGIPENESTNIICHTNLYGYDIDPIACMIAQWNIQKISGRKTNIFHKDTLTSGDLFNRQYNSMLFDVIIGNPPWGAYFTKEQKQYFKQHYISALSGINSFTLFIEKSLSLLRNHGILSFLIPEAYLNIKAHQKSRELVLSLSVIKEIVQWGDCFKGVYAPAISLTIQKEPCKDVRKKNIVHIKHGKSLINLAKNTAHLIPQHMYSESYQNIFSINYSRKAVALLEHIQSLSYITLKDRVKFFLGIVTGNNEHHISNTRDSLHPDPIIVGKDVEKFRITFSGHYFKYNVATLQQVAEKSCYLTPNKIVYKFIGKHLTFAVDPHGFYTLNNVNGFIPLSPDLDPDILTAILNSRLLQYIYDTQFFTVKVLRGNLEKLPIKIINSSNKNMLKNLSLTLREETNEHKRKLLMDSIDDIIYHEYHISDIVAHHINDTMEHFNSIA